MNLIQFSGTLISGTLAALLPLSAAAQSLDGGQLPTQSRLAFAPEVSQADTGAGAEIANASGQSTDELSKQLSNPNSPLSTLVLKQTYTSFDGDLPGADDQSSNVTLFQPVFPFPIAENTNLFIRPALAYVWQQPVYDANTNVWHNKSGVADIGFDIAVGRSYDSGWVLIGGMQGTIPTDTDVSGKQWRLGPEALIANVGEKAYWAIFPSHQWDINGDYDYSTTQLEIFGGVFLPNAWTLYTDSTMSYDWEAKQWTVPLNVSVRKVTKIGKVPVQFNFGIDYFVESNDIFGQDWAVKFSIAPVVPNFIYDAING